MCDYVTINFKQIILRGEIESVCPMDFNRLSSVGSIMHQLNEGAPHTTIKQERTKVSNCSQFLFCDFLGTSCLIFLSVTTCPTTQPFPGWPSSLMPAGPGPNVATRYRGWRGTAPTTYVTWETTCHLVSTGHVNQYGEPVQP